MKKILLILVLFPTIFFSQEKAEQTKRNKENPILYVDFLLGPSTENGNLGTVYFGGELNYQIKKDLFSIRFIENTDLKTGWVFIIPVFVQRSKNNETALLYGKRFIDDNKSYSFSGGISYNKYTNFNLEFENNTLFVNIPTNQIPASSETYFAVPFEAEVRWFNSRKERFRVFYGIIPIGNSTGFARSFGFKLIGNLSKRSYVGIGLVFGLGFHKEY
jgi:hypothetical protein